MKKLVVALFSFFLLMAVSEAQAQSAAADNAKTKDEFWGTPKTNRGVSADAVGARSESLDERYNAYETGKRSNFRLMKYNNKKLKELQKKEEKLLKKYKKEKKQRERRKRKD